MTGFRRPMDFGGSWYPAQEGACRSAIESFSQDDDDAGVPPQAGPGIAPQVHDHSAPQVHDRTVPQLHDRTAPQVRLGIAPHAGWIYSGRLAARVYRGLAAGPAVELVVVLGGHLRSSDPLVAMTEGSWDTPFGAFTIHEGFADTLLKHEPVRWERDGRYVPDNSTELQLPFAKWAFPNAELLPMRVPPAPQAVALGDALEDYLRSSGLNAVVVASTDLTHYGPNYGFTPKGSGPQALAWVREENDPAFIAAVEGGDPRTVLAVNHRRHCACSAGAVATVAALARRRGQRFTALGYGTSADNAGTNPALKENFVGYLAGVYG